jgi:4-hydroxybenzoate polyprenyltransferase/phosphoserine phosphatase
MWSAAGAKPAKVVLPVLCVDLDGTLIRGNVLWECVLILLKTRPFAALLIPFWLASGRAACKRQLARRIDLDPSRLSYRQPVLDLLRAEKLAGRRIVLATAADRRIAEAIAAYLGLIDLGLIDEVHASDGEVNLKGANKAALLTEQFAQTGYEYVGDSAADVEVWRNARGAYVVGSEARAEQAAAVTQLKGTILEPQVSFRAWFGIWINALRGHHWAKNLLLFLPLILSHNLAVEPLTHTLAGFVLYGLCASGLYILNDLLDLHSDREHPWKKERPFAAGAISIPEGLLASSILLSAALSLGFLLDPQFGAVLFGYAVLTMLYSLYLKKIALLDVFILSSFYSFRILAGALISGTPLSQWFLAFSMFFFLSLAMAKRYSELLHAGDLIQAGNSGRSYRTGDRELLLSLGIGSSFSSVVIFSLYVHSQDVLLLYSSPDFLFLLCPIVLYWLSRNWLLAHRGELKEDPVTLAIRDPVSYAVAAASAVVIAASMIHVNW